MRWGGVTLLLFIVWHLLNFTIGKVNVTGGATNDPYNLLVDTFDVWWLTLIYLVAMAMLGAHLHHGIWSSLQTLGLTSSGALARPRQAARLRARASSSPAASPSSRSSSWPASSPSKGSAPP